MIASDLSAILYARRIGMEVHISTQCNLTNSEAVKFFSQWADVVVLARELSLDQIAPHRPRDRRAADLRPFGRSGAHRDVRPRRAVHGRFRASATCRCTRRDVRPTGAPAARSAAANTLTDVETGAQLAAEGQSSFSPKDLCTIDFLDRFVGAGVRVLKIEGRARGAEYVKRVVA